MNTTSQQTHISLAQRIAKVRNCMLVEIATGVSPTDKDLFASLCEAYEQNNIVLPSSNGMSSQNVLNQVFSSNLVPESIVPYKIAAIAEIHASPKQHRIGFSIIRWSDSADLPPFGDWDNGDSTP